MFIFLHGGLAFNYCHQLRYDIAQSLFYSNAINVTYSNGALTQRH